MTCKTSGLPGQNFGDFCGPRAAERYFLRLAVQRTEKRKTSNTAKTLGFEGVKMVSAEGIEPSTY